MGMNAQSKKDIARNTITSEDAERPEAQLSPLEELKDDILVGLKQVQAGQVVDADQSLREIRRELGIDEN